MKRAVSLTVAVALVMTCCMVAFAAPQASADKGKEVYAKQNCKLCHSIAGVGNKKTPLDGVGAKLSEDQMKKWVRTPKEMNAKSLMTAYAAGKLSDSDLADLVAYMMTLKK